jgi:hypothetical protein
MCSKYHRSKEKRGINSGQIGVCWELEGRVHFSGKRE